MAGLCPSAHDRDAEGRMPRYGFALEHRLSRCPKGRFAEPAAGPRGKEAADSSVVFSGISS